MKDLNNSFFRFNNMFGFDEFNQNEKQNEKDSNDESEQEEEKQESSKNLYAPEPQIDFTKQRKIMTDWLDAEYNSSFHFKKVNVTAPNNAYHNQKSENIKNEFIDIEDPIVIYDYIKKYTNFLYDYNCPKDIEKIIVNKLVTELKSYYKLHSTEGLDAHLNRQFIKLKNTYLSIANTKQKIGNITFSTDKTYQR